MAALSKENVLVKLSDEFLEIIDKQGKPFVEKMDIEAKKAGLSRSARPYLFHVLLGSTKHWPEMNSIFRKHGLRTGRDIMVHDRATPVIYDRDVVPPEPGDEEKINQILYNVASWCAGSMAHAILMGYRQLVKEYGLKYARQLDPEYALPGFEDLYMRALFQEELQENPHLFRASDLLKSAILLWQRGW